METPDKNRRSNCCGDRNLFANKDDTQRAGATVAGNGAACDSFIGILEIAVLLGSVDNSCVGFLVNYGAGNEKGIRVNIFATFQPLLNIVYKTLGVVAAILLANAHLAILDFNAGLQVQQVGAQSC